MSKQKNTIGQIVLTDDGGVWFSNFCMHGNYASCYEAMAAMVDAFYEECKVRIAKERYRKSSYSITMPAQTLATYSITGELQPSKSTDNGK